jgi:5-methylthioribose kinase
MYEYMTIVAGIAHVADLDSIEDTDGRSQCEKRALLFARRLVLSSAPSAPAEKATTIRLLAEEARAMYKSSPGDSWAV